MTEHIDNIKIEGTTDRVPHAYRSLKGIILSCMKHMPNILSYRLESPLEQIWPA